MCTVVYCCYTVNELLYHVPVPQRYLQIQSTYQPGDRIQCSAEGKPEPSYHWTDLVSGTVIQGAVLVITEDMLNNSYTFQCTANNQFNNISSTVHFTVECTVVFILRNVSSCLSYDYTLPEHISCLSDTSTINHQLKFTNDLTFR